MSPGIKLIDRYGPPNLIALLRNARWKKCDGGKNFSSLVLGGYCLTQPMDELCCAGYRVTVIDMSSGEEFTIAGYSFPNMMRSVEKPSPAFEEHRIGKHVLEKKASSGLRHYRIGLEICVPSA
jgi:hypothetical protein